MAFTPTGYTSWGISATNIAEPLDSKKIVGWSVNEQPASSYFNWLENKRDQWINYLAWKDKLRPVVDDDFAYQVFGGNAVSYVQPTNVMAPMWQAGTSGRFWVGGGDVASGGAIGNVFFAADFGVGSAANTGNVFIKKLLNGPGNSDFFMDYYFNFNGVSSGGSFEMGYLGFMSFITTGASGTWGLCFKPSGVNATSIAMGEVAVGTGISNNYRKFSLLRDGPTMTIRVNDIARISLPATPLDPAAFVFGAQGTYYANNFSAAIDRISLFVERPLK